MCGLRSAALVCRRDVAVGGRLFSIPARRGRDDVDGTACVEEDVVSERTTLRTAPGTHQNHISGRPDVMSCHRSAADSHPPGAARLNGQNNGSVTNNAGFPANAQRTQRKERNEMTSLSDRQITAASDDSVCRWHAAKLWQTHAAKI